MLWMLESLLATAPLESLFVVEADERFSFPLLPEAARWDVRTYRPLWWEFSASGRSVGENSPQSVILSTQRRIYAA